MATRSPTQTHSYWGKYGTGSLPQSANVEVGDTAFDTTLGQLVQAISLGPVVWEAVGTGTSGPPSGAASGDLSGTYPSPTVAALQGNSVAAISPADGQVLTWNGTDWVPGAPASGGSGGGGQTYFMNVTTPPGGQAPVPVVGTQQLGLVAEVPLTTVTSGTLPTNGTTFVTVAEFVTDLNVPGLDAIPAGIWDCNVWAQGAGPSLAANDIRFRVLVYKWNGVTATLLATSGTAPLYDPTQTVQYLCSALLPQTTLNPSGTDRIYLELQATAIAPNHTITFSFGDSTPSHTHTTLPSIAGTGIVHVINGVVQSPASAVNLAGGVTEILNTLPVGNGGTGSSATPTNGQIPIGNGTSYTPATLTAGSNISITNASGAISVAATGVVTSVGAASPITTSGGTTPTIGLGTVGVANGGTGLTTAPSNGQLLIGNGTDYTQATLTAGSGISITNASGAISIAASGGGGGITALTQDVVASGTGSVAATVQGMGGASSKTHFVIEGGTIYATLQDAVNAASANDVIMVGPKSSGHWGNVLLNVVNKPLIIAAMSGAGSNKIVKIGSVTYDLGTTGPALNANLNETYLYGLYIQGAFAGGSAVTLTGGANYPGRLRLYGCYVLNTDATGTAAITNSNAAVDINGIPTSSLYLDSCVVSLTPSAAGSTIVQTAGYTLIRNRSDVSGSLNAAATGSAIKVSAGIVEILDSSISINRAGNTSSTIDIPLGSSATTFVSAGYSTISNNSDAATSACVNIGTAGATFGAGDATLASGASVAAAGFAVKGIGGGSFLYANVSFSYRTVVSTVTATATAQSGGLFSYGMSVGASALVAPTFVLNSTGNITKLNNITTSFPSAQGTANQVLTNNGSGTLTWANGNLNTLGSVGATPTAANLRTNTVYTVNVAAVALPTMAAGDDGLVISLVNISGAGSTVTPSTGVARSMTTGGGQTWVWRNTGTTWYCLSNV